MESKEWRVLELFSGIGGMHRALKESCTRFTVVAAVDINTIANDVYRENHPETEVWNRNVQAIGESEIDSLDIDTILMSPPCQPFTRVGKKQDLDDRRTDGFIAICANLLNCRKIERVLMENVKGFETSRAREMFVLKLRQMGFFCREFLLSPQIVGIPNSRTRYYCIARRHRDFSHGDSQGISEELPGKFDLRDLSEFIDTLPDGNEYRLPAKSVGKNCWVLDIVSPSSKNSMCFTKAYTHFLRGTGSIFCPKEDKVISETFSRLEKIPAEDQEFPKILDSLEMRFFTPDEVAKLMGFTGGIKWPEDVTNQQKYKLLGNSLNVSVVRELVNLLESS
ncbi:tRNA (cytosine(38)-C(5))-methyltransferase [Phlebotomus papatasi]|uniref:tRNA (cytosine(38)-C(5))-methyltransferase n=1 Tax=Phlebotomus papatasi TaxID=29031 RepID=A0A1B0DR06_PHLPP|nr:tRNA (cytosine(38)-C(5))-methyltransferase [Phlebotomus papatasi]